MNISIFKYQNFPCLQGFWKKFIFCLVMVCACNFNAIFSQTLHSLTFEDELDSASKILYQKGTSFHPSIRPYISEETNKLGGLEIKNSTSDSAAHHSKHLHLSAYPLAGIYPGFDISSKNTLGEFSAGASVRGNYSDKAAFPGGRYSGQKPFNKMYFRLRL